MGFGVWDLGAISHKCNFLHFLLELFCRLGRSFSFITTQFANKTSLCLGIYILFLFLLTCRHQKKFNWKKIFSRMNPFLQKLLVILHNSEVKSTRSFVLQEFVRSTRKNTIWGSFLSVIFIIFMNSNMP